ncbi:MAG: hypothetical protein AB7N71_08215 [Phycisphaerae bacterium]
MTRIGKNLLIILASITSSQSLAATLIYSDQTIGTVQFERLWTRTSQPALVVHSVEKFVEQLNFGLWDRVVVVGEYKGTVPAFYDDLVSFAKAYPEVRIQINYWYAGPEFEPRAGATSIYATTSLYLWSQGYTHACYNNGVWLDKSRPNVFVESDQHFPDFKEVTIKKPRYTGKYGNTQTNVPPQNDDVAGNHRVDPCNPSNCESCMTCFDFDVNQCDDNKDADTQTCNTVYENDPVKRAQCIVNVNNHHSDCVDAASDRFELCEIQHDCDSQNPKN